MYIITEKIGDYFYRAPTYMTFEEYVEWRSKKQNGIFLLPPGRYGLGSSGSSSGVEDPIAKFNLKTSLIDRLFGGTTVDQARKATSTSLSDSITKIQNPILTLRQQRHLAISTSTWTST